MNTVSKIKVRPEEGTGNLVRTFKKSKDKGYLVIESSEQVVQGGWIKEVTRTALIKGNIKLLDTLAKHSIPGRIVLLEYLESQLPDEMQIYLDQTVEDYEERIAQFIKRAGTDGPEMCNGAERILRFCIWDATGKMSDVTVAHDNQEQIAAWRKENVE